jgi:hypothetical protein
MELLHSKLSIIYSELFSTPLVQTRKVTPDNLAEFTTALNNKDLFTETSDKWQMIQYMFKHNKPAFYRYLQDANLQYLALLSDGEALTTVLRLRGIVTIRRNEAVFVVVEHKQRNNTLRGINASRESRGPGIPAPRRRGRSNRGPKKLSQSDFPTLHSLGPALPQVKRQDFDTVPSDASWAEICDQCDWSARAPEPAQVDALPLPDAKNDKPASRSDVIIT